MNRFSDVCGEVCRRLEVSSAPGVVERVETIQRSGEVGRLLVSTRADTHEVARVLSQSLAERAVTFLGVACCRDDVLVTVDVRVGAPHEHKLTWAYGARYEGRRLYCCPFHNTGGDAQSECSGSPRRQLVARPAPRFVDSTPFLTQGVSSALEEFKKAFTEHTHRSSPVDKLCNDLRVGADRASPGWDVTAVMQAHLVKEHADGRRTMYYGTLSPGCCTSDSVDGTLHVWNGSAWVETPRRREAYDWLEGAPGGIPGKFPTARCMASPIDSGDGPEDEEDEEGDEDDEADIAELARELTASASCVGDVHVHSSQRARCACGQEAAPFCVVNGLRVPEVGQSLPVMQQKLHAHPEFGAAYALFRDAETCADEEARKKLKATLREWPTCHRGGVVTLVGETIGLLDDGGKRVGNARAMSWSCSCVDNGEFKL